MSIQPTPNIDYTNKDYDAFKQLMLGQLKLKMPEYTDLSETDTGVVILELLARGLDILSFNQDVQANEAFLVTEEQRENALKWCSMLDYTPRSASPAKFEQIFVLATPKNTATLIPCGTRVKTRESSLEPSVLFETTEDLTIPANCLGNEVNSKGEYLYSTTVVQGFTVSNELLGSSDGSADQTFPLSYSSVLKDSVALLVNEGFGFEPWERVDTFLDSSATDKHYKVSTIDGNTTVVTFGNGVTGKIPDAFVCGIYATYRVGGGTIGNVSSNTIVAMETNTLGISETFNPSTPIEKGFDEETLDEIKINAPNSYRNKWACLCEKDYSDRVKELFPSVALASAERSREVGEIDVINVYIMLCSNEAPTDTLLKEIKDMYESRALIGTSVRVLPTNIHTFVPVVFKVNAIVKDRYSRENIKSEITAFLQDYFKLGNYDFGAECSLTELESLILEDTLGIRSIRISASSGICSESDFIIKPDIFQILSLSSIQFTITGGNA